MKHHFKEPFQLVSHGKDNEIEFIEIPAPTAKIVACCDLEEEINKALMHVATNREKLKIDDQNIDPKDHEKADISEEIGYMLAMGNASLKRCYNALKDCITQSKSMLNGEIRCSASIYEEIPYKELKDLLGDYIGNFINSLL